MGTRAERSPHGRGARAGQADLPKRKPNLKKLWPQIKALVAPRMGLLLAGMGLMVINRVAGLVLPYHFQAAAGQGAQSGSSASRSAAQIHRAGLLGHGGAGHYLVLAHATALQGRPAADRRDAPPGPAPCGPALRLLLRREPHRHAGRAHHDRRGRRAQPGRHRPGGVCRRPADRRAGLYLSAASQRRRSR